MSESRGRTRKAEQISTGNQILDRRLAGGLYTGSLLAIRTSPASQSEAILYTLMKERPTLYISTVRRQDAIERDLERIATAEMDFEVAAVGKQLKMDSEMVKKITGSRSLTAGYGQQSDILDEVYELLQSLDAGANVIIDPVNTLERFDDEEKYRTVLNELKERVMEVGGLGVLHCISHDGAPMHRETTLTIADTVWTLEHISRAQEKYNLTVSKNRGEPVAREKLELFLDRYVQIDDTRNV